jgi:diaminopimelate epimerase
MIKFTKMQGTGNDFIVIDGRKNKTAGIKKIVGGMCDRHYGIGADGVLVLHDSSIANFKMVIFNPDGSEAEMCGNGIRCFAKYIHDNILTKQSRVTVETLAGIKKLDCIVKNGEVKSVVVNMGEPVLQREQIPMIGPPGMVINETLHLADGTRFEITSLSMGNPHVIIFVEEIENFPIDKYGPLVENHALFPNRTNVEFVKVIDNKKVIQRTWERGTGETLSCGTGACAVAVACILNKLTSRKIVVRLKGGDLRTEWNEKDNFVYLNGPAEEVFRGEWRD